MTSSSSSSSFYSFSSGSRQYNNTEEDQVAEQDTPGASGFRQPLASR